MECILGSCLPQNFQKLGGPSQPVRKLGGTRPTGPIGWLRLCKWNNLINPKVLTVAGYERTALNEPYLKTDKILCSTEIRIGN